jgi:Mlc titration factor MtfA (ptsG expression regulator)
MKVMASPFPDQWEEGLFSHVFFYRALDEPQKSRFRNLVKVFIDEVPITGIRTDVDELTRALVAASAVIPIFGFDDWEYSGLGEVLIYPGAFGEDYRTDDGISRNTLGMVGVGHLSGVMILSKPALIAGFTNAEDKRNVGVHEFAHLVDKADGSVDGIPAGIPRETVEPWIRWVGEELRRDSKGGHHIDDYAYTNEAEYFAVLSEYFFEAPDVLEKKNPNIYRMLESMYRQNTKRFLTSSRRRGKRIGRNAPCPCGSGEKFKRCCRRTRRRMPQKT